MLATRRRWADLNTVARPTHVELGRLRLLPFTLFNAFLLRCCVTLVVDDGAFQAHCWDDIASSRGTVVIDPRGIQWFIPAEGADHPVSAALAAILHSGDRPDTLGLPLPLT